jgi:hypothetical protein
MQTGALRRPAQFTVRHRVFSGYAWPMNALLLYIALASPTAHAGDFFLSATADQVPSGRDVGGLNWVRVFNNLRDGGWWMGHHWELDGSPGYNVAPMTEDLEIDMSSRIRLAEWENIKDHGIERCPDGSFLHVYSLNVTNDGARAARYTEDWDIVSQGEVETGAPERAHNDMPVICSEHLQGVAFTNKSDFKATLFEIGPDSTVTATHTLDTNVHISGGAFRYDPLSDRFLMTSNGGFENPELQAIWLNRDLSIDERVDFEPIPTLHRHFWPQALMRIGDYWLLGFLGEATPGQYLAGDGDVYLAVLNDDFETIETMKVSDNTDGSGLGSARPSFARHMDQLLVAWDKGFQPHTAVVTLDLVAFGLDEDDSGFVPPEGDGGDGSGSLCDTGTLAVGGADEAPEGDTTDDLEGDSKDDWEEGGTDEGIKEDPCAKGCGCAYKPKPTQLVWALLIGVIGFAQRRD